MDNSDSYCIMIFSPLFWLVMKLSIQYTMIYEIPTRKMSKSFIKKNKGGLWESFFSWKLKDRVSHFLFCFHAFLAIMVLIGVFQMIIYSVLAINGYELQIGLLIQLVVDFDIILSLVRICSIVFFKVSRK